MVQTVAKLAAPVKQKVVIENFSYEHFKVLVTAIQPYVGKREMRRLSGLSKDRFKEIFSDLKEAELIKLKRKHSNYVLTNDGKGWVDTLRPRFPELTQTISLIKRKEGNKPIFEIKELSRKSDALPITK